MREPKILLHRFKIIFQLGCFLFAVYFTTLFSAQYSENSDAQLIKIKKFNQDGDNKYPTFSFCFNGPRFHWFHDLKIFNSYGLNATQYERMLSGETAEKYERNNFYRSYTKTPVFLNSDTDMDVNRFYRSTVQVQDFVKALHFATEGTVNDTTIRNLSLIHI